MARAYDDQRNVVSEPEVQADVMVQTESSGGTGTLAAIHSASFRRSATSELVGSDVTSGRPLLAARSRLSDR